tara:strand:+ start:325 stop:573 length:249 start_codon:yes stop_codon:yes gene_type:complete
MGLKKGDLIRFKKTGHYATVIRDEYIHRFIEAEDLDMIACGMGHLAGIYGTAIDIHITNTGEIRKPYQVNHKLIEVVSKSRP